MTNDYLYETKSINKDGVNGMAYVDREDGLRVVVSSPLNDSPGTNPEELLGLSLSTCFNSTIKAILREKKIDQNSRVEVPVQLKKEDNGSGYFFEVEVHAAVDGVAQNEAEEIVDLASNRCPVYKLVKASHTVSLKTIPFS